VKFVLQSFPADRISAPVLSNLSAGILSFRSAYHRSSLDYCDLDTDQRRGRRTGSLQEGSQPTVTEIDQLQGQAAQLHRGSSDRGRRAFALLRCEG